MLKLCRRLNKTSIYMKIEKALINLNKFFQYIPVASTLSSAVNACLKYIFLGTKEKYQGDNLYYRHIHKISGARLMLLSIPVIGNVTVALLDLTQKKRPQDSQPEISSNFYKDENAVFASSVEKNVNEKANALWDFFKLPEEQRTKRGVILEFVRKNGRLLEHVPEEFRDDDEIVRTAFENDPSSIQFATGEVKKQIQESIKSDDDRYFYARVPDQKRVITPIDEEIEDWEDRDFVLSRVQSRGSDLRYASDSVKMDRDVVLEAVKQDGNALRFAHKRFLDDDEIVEAAMRKEPSVFYLASSRIQGEPKFIKLFADL